MDGINGLSFEAVYAELETIIQQLDAGSLPLDESVRLYERGRLLTDYCQNLLDAAELRVSKLTDDGDTVEL